MSDRPSGLDEVELSDLIGEIYDCVIDPTRWDATLDRLRSLLNCLSCSVLPQAASALGISQNTAKTHLSRLFAKTGTQRQANLIALVSKLVPPVAPPGSSDG